MENHLNAQRDDESRDRLPPPPPHPPWGRACPVSVAQRGGASAGRGGARPTVVLPQPDSPTRPKVSPAAMAKSTPFTACSQAAPATRKCFLSACASSSD